MTLQNENTYMLLKAYTVRMWFVFSEFLLKTVMDFCTGAKNNLKVVSKDW